LSKIKEIGNTVIPNTNKINHQSKTNSIE